MLKCKNAKLIIPKGDVMSEEKFRRLVEKRVPGLFFILTIFAIIEFGILMVCVFYSGNQDIVKIYNPENELVYENFYNANHVSEFKSIYGIDNFKEEGFIVKRIVLENKFPTRAWIALSICIPIAVILFVVFIEKVFTDMFPYKAGSGASSENQNKENGKEGSGFEETRFEKLFSTLGRLNIYSLGSTVIIVVFLYWMIPDLLIHLGKISYQTISELKWVILCVVLLGGAYILLKTVLLYKTKTEIIKQQAEIQIHRDKLAFEARQDKPLLEDKSDD